MPRSLKFGNAILCDYVARGHVNKHTLVNVIAGNVIVGNLPATVSFGLYLEVMPQDGQKSDIKLEVLAGGESVIEALAESQELTAGEPAVLVVPHFMFHTEKDVLLEVYVSVTGFKRTLAMKKTISKGVIPSNV